MFLKSGSTKVEVKMVEQMFSAENSETRGVMQKGMGVLWENMASVDKERSIDECQLVAWSH